MARNKKAGPHRRSGCPLNASVEMLGDRWSLLIVRDMMLRGSCTYSEFLNCYEGIATNILADRLQKLVAYEIISAESDPADGRKQKYFLTRKGIDLAPVLTEMVLWAAAHEKTDNPQLVRQMRNHREKFLAGVRQRWAESRARRATTRHVAGRQATTRHATTRHATTRHVAGRHVAGRHVAPHHTTLQRADDRAAKHRKRVA